ncbi:MAG: hypothetical protein IE909_18430 [Campylobacterales bacterium]|nr:hypothetical protein [Campylobacterales bacterium]
MQIGIEIDSNTTEPQYEKHTIVPYATYFIDTNTSEISTKIPDNLDKEELSRYIQFYYYDLARIVIVISLKNMKSVNFSADQLPMKDDMRFITLSAIKEIADSIE